MTQEERFWNKVDAEGDCWLWTGGGNAQGHGHVNFKDQNGIRRTIIASRFAWQVLVGPIPEGLELDHLCRNPPCVNPDHLEPVTHRENMLRIVPTMRAFKDSLPGKCSNGHSWIENTRFNQRGVRECSACNVDRVRANRQAKKVST